jgi:hypothetical protein
MPEKAQSVVKTSSRQGDMFGKKLGATDDSWLAKGRQAHGLCRIKFGILECGQASEAVNHHWRKFCPLDINLIAQYDVHLTGKRTYDREFLVATGRRGAAPSPGLTTFRGHPRSAFRALMIR